MFVWCPKLGHFLIFDAIEVSQTWERRNQTATYYCFVEFSSSLNSYVVISLIASSDENHTHFEMNFFILKDHSYKNKIIFRPHFGVALNVIGCFKALDFYILC